MTRLRPIFLAALLSACVVDSKSLGQPDEGSSSADDGSSTGDVEPGTCEPAPRFSCTQPFDGDPPGGCGGIDFDENCCMRPSCQDNDACAAGEFCVPAGLNMSCEDDDVGNGPECRCFVENSGFARDVCVPAEMIALDWCAGYLDGNSCAAAAQQQRSEEDIQFCQWVDVHVLTIDGSTDSCTVGEPEGRCLTIQQGFDPGCAGEPCGIGPEPTSMANPFARFVDAGTTIEAFGVDDVFCGSGHPLGEWLHASDPSFGACTFSCGYDNPCAMSLSQYAESVAQSSKDAPVDDCGDVDLDDSLAAWQDAHDCAVEHASTGLGFRVLWAGQGIDSVVRHAAVGMQGESYGVALLDVDQAPTSPYTLYQTGASGIEATEGCTVEVGEICLTPTDVGESVQLCPAE